MYLYVDTIVALGIKSIAKSIAKVLQYFFYRVLLKVLAILFESIANNPEHMYCNYLASYNLQVYM